MRLVLAGGGGGGGGGAAAPAAGGAAAAAPAKEEKKEEPSEEDEVRAPHLWLWWWSVCRCGVFGCRHFSVRVFHGLATGASGLCCQFYWTHMDVAAVCAESFLRHRFCVLMQAH